MKKIIPYFLVAILSTTGLCQSTNISTFFLNNKKKADYYYSQGAYKNALEIYLFLADKGKADIHVKRNVADCYFKIQDPISAEKWYAAMTNDAEFLPSDQLSYARVLCMNQKYDKAIEILHAIDKKKTDSAFITSQIDFLQNIDRYSRDSLHFLVDDADKLNSEYSDFGASYFRNNVVFVSTRDYDVMVKYKSLSATQTEEAISNLFFAYSPRAGSYDQVKLFRKEDMKSRYHDGPATFYDDNKRIAFTQSNILNNRPVKDISGHVNLMLYLGEVADFGKLKNVVPFPFNYEGYSIGHATFSKNGEKIYFSSTRPLGFGGADIYYSLLKDGNWSEPVNVGPSINTAGDELYPHLQNDSTLFFVSAGHGGFGGLDIFTSNRDHGQFTKAHNLGFPINTSYDDFSFVTDSTGRGGYLSSNRPGGKGLDDIYFFIAKNTFIAGVVRERNNPSVVVPGASIQVKDEDGILYDTTQTDLHGHFRIDLPFERNFTLTAKKDGYEVLTDIGFSTKGIPFGIDDLSIPAWKYSLYSKGRIFSNETQSILRGATVTLTDQTTGKIDTIAINEQGEYNSLLLPDHLYKIEAHKPGFITNSFTLDTKNLFDGELVNDIVLEETYIEKAVTLFDYNQSLVRPQDHESLNYILRTLKKYPQSILNIDAHADSRGSKDYNKRLSEKRALALVQYFLDRGIARERIEAIGFGEGLMLNQCSDGVKCPEEDHYKNRRGEIKVQINSIE